MVPGAFSVADFFALLSEDLASARPCTDVQGYAIKRFSDRATKKYRGNGVVNKEADAAAISKFLFVNERAHDVKITADPIIIGEAASFIHHVLERGTRILTNKLGERLNILPVSGVCLDLRLISHMWSIGPGSNTGAEKTHFIDKMSGKLSSTQKAVPYYRYLSDVSPLIFPALDSRLSDKGVSIVRGSKVALVPKTPEISRVIAKEPIVNMCLQLAAGNFISNCLSLVGCHIPTQQDKNKALARFGSLIGDSGDSLCTLDLESASDLITPQLCKKLLPQEWFYFLNDIRSEVASVPGVGEIQINSMSTMGNGFTFPLMTLIMLSLVYAVRRVYENSRRNYVDFSKNAVFGDDIIISKNIYEKMTSVLSEVGLLVNIEKSYKDGYFKESCGGDYFRGFDVTPVYIKDLTAIRGRVIALNQLLSWSAKHVMLTGSIEYLVSAIPRKFLTMVPLWESADAGVQSPVYRNKYTRTVYRPQSVRSKKLDPNFKLGTVLGGFAESDDCLEDYLFYLPRYAKTFRRRETRASTTVWSIEASGVRHEKAYQVRLEQIIEIMIGS